MLVRNSTLCSWSHYLWQYFKNGTVDRVAYLQDTLGFVSSTAFRELCCRCLMTVTMEKYYSAYFVLQMMMKLSYNFFVKFKVLMPSCIIR